MGCVPCFSSLPLVYSHLCIFPCFKQHRCILISVMFDVRCAGSALAHLKLCLCLRTRTRTQTSTASCVRPRLPGPLIPGGHVGGAQFGANRSCLHWMGFLTVAIFTELSRRTRTSQRVNPRMIRRFVNCTLMVSSIASPLER